MAKPMTEEEYSKHKYECAEYIVGGITYFNPIYFIKHSLKCISEKDDPEFWAKKWPEDFMEHYDLEPNQHRLTNEQEELVRSIVDGEERNKYVGMLTTMQQLKTSVEFKLVPKY